MTARCVEAPKDAPMIIIRQEYVAICNGRLCAAALLNYFEHWTNTKIDQEDTDLWIPISQADLPDALMNLFSHSQIKTDLMWLREMEYLLTRNNERVPFSRQLRYLFNIDAVQAAVDVHWFTPTDALGDSNQSIGSHQPMDELAPTNGLVHTNQSIGQPEPVISLDSFRDSFIEILPEEKTRAREGPNEKDLSHWQMAYEQLKLQLDAASFEPFLRDARLLAVERPIPPPPSPAPRETWVIGVRSPRAADRCAGRLHQTIERIIADCASLPRETIGLRFEAPELVDAVPLPAVGSNGRHAGVRP